jgi:hypothetical protein
MRLVCFTFYNLAKPSLIEGGFAVVVQSLKQQVAVVPASKEDSSVKVPL